MSGRILGADFTDISRRRPQFVEHADTSRRIGASPALVTGGANVLTCAVAYLRALEAS
jgi:hypothetical protein